MAVPACLRLSDAVFPRVRAHAARRLAEAQWSQTRIAQALGVSQAMVSKYQSRPLPPADPLVHRLVDDLVASLGGQETVRGTSPWCVTLTQREARPGLDAALDDLLAAEARLVEASPMAIMPEVGINIARALPGAQGPPDVLAYPARIVGGAGRFLRPEPPALGASTHLAEILLCLRRIDPAVQALANIRGGPRVATAAGPDLVVEGEGPRRALIQDLIAGRLPQAGKWTIHDPGAVGIEPCLYVAAPDAAQAVDRIQSIARSLAPEPTP